MPTNLMQKFSAVKNDDVLKLLWGEYHDPHHFLGLHDTVDGKKVIRLFRPHATQVFIQLFGEEKEATCIDPSGFFEVVVPSHTTSTDYKVYHHSGLLSYDPYSFLPSVGELDLYLFSKGVHYELYHIMGAHVITHQGVKGVRYVVWAPSAKRVSLVADFNHWDGRVNLMRSLGSSGVWELFVPGLQEGEKYKFEIKTQHNEILIKSDPFGLTHEMRPLTASIVADVDCFQWNDKPWMERRSQNNQLDKPINIYEVHLGSWKKENGHFLNYKDLAIQLAKYCLEMNFTHVELMPIQEHPLDESWGYQVTGFFAPTSRFGTPEEFQWFINHLHENNIGVLLDWVPGHFPTDHFSLARFDGTALYEHEDPRQGYHPHWNTYIFNFGRNEVSNFLIASALFWLEKMHVDGLRVDAVASMLYLDYGREEGEWIPNRYGGKENLEAIEFLKHLNSIIHQRNPGVLMIAEESTSFAKVSYSVEDGGLGFDMKWNMGWMNDTLRYFSKDMLFRNYHHHDLTFGLLYAFSEKFILVFSHDEVVHGKKSLLSRMPGDVWQKFANLRLLYSYMICQPGKKLLFMGGEIAQWNEWNSKNEMEWSLLNYIPHQEIKRLVKEINFFYLQHRALWERDFHHSTFEWVNYDDTKNSVISYLRKSNDEILFCVHNFTPGYHNEYFFPLRNVKSVQEVFNTDDSRFGGSDKKNVSPRIVSDEHNRTTGLLLEIPPLATMIFKVSYYDDRKGIS